jgi:pSer/pThr/pTyr-binding forkhead associated (FHA) protein
MAYDLTINVTVLLSIEGNMEELTFRAQSIHFGKHPHNEICTSGHSVRVSRNHAMMNWDGETWLISGLNSRYGTYVNDQRVEGNAALVVKSGDQIRIGDIELYRKHTKIWIRVLNHKDTKNTEA